MNDFYRFPHTPHVAWLSPGTPREDKVLSPDEATDFLSADVVVEEKIDGANTGLSLDAQGRLRAQNRGSYLERGAHPQFAPLWPWLDARRVALERALGPDLMLFGEWCFAIHSVRYDRLADWFLAFDVYDRRQQRFWSTPLRDALCEDLDVRTVPRVATGRFDFPGLRALLGMSKAGPGPMEGVYVRREDADWLLARSKLVRAEFVQEIGEHWSKRTLERNTVRAA